MGGMKQGVYNRRSNAFDPIDNSNGDWKCKHHNPWRIPDGHHVETIKLHEIVIVPILGKTL